MKSTILVFLVSASILIGSCSKRAAQEDVANQNAHLPKLAEVDLANIDPGQFSIGEWYMPYYLKHFARVANSVVDSGANRGYIDLSVWRSEPVNKPYDARIMENIMSLAWFYTTNRPWNPYYSDPALKVRIEAALDFWCNMQSDDGQFSEYAPQKWGLAPTAFATKFIGRALLLLHDGPPIDSDIYERARKAWRKALYIGFTDKDLWRHGRNYTNQFANLWGGALMYLKRWPDKEIEQLFHDRFRQSMSEFQSPCGFFYEAGGPDWGYDLSTHHSDLHMAWNFAEEKEIRDDIMEKTGRWYDWFSYNALKEPGSSRFYLNRAIETRQHHGFYETDDTEDPAYARYTPQAEYVPMARAFQLSEQEYEDSLHSRYAAMRAMYPEVAPLVTGEFNAFSPYAFVHQGLVQWHPSEQQKVEALANLPYLKNNRFTQVRHDNRANTSYIFVRRPYYYAIFNSGKIITKQQRYGLGIVWNPILGTILQSQSKTDVAAWGTKASDSQQVYEASDLNPEIIVNGKLWTPEEGKNDLDCQSLKIQYPLGDHGRKSIRFEDDKIVVQVQHGGDFIEILPLLAAEDGNIHPGDDEVDIKTASGSAHIELNNAEKISKLAFDEDLGPKACYVLEVKANGNLSYSITFE